jgi:hypothetical protein
MSDDFTIRIALTEEDFRALVAGQAVQPQQASAIRPTRVVEIILSDIGWDRMKAAIEDAMPPRGRPMREEPKWRLAEAREFVRRCLVIFDQRPDDETVEATARKVLRVLPRLVGEP